MGLPATSTSHSSSPFKPICPPFLKFEFEIISQYGVYMRRNPIECPVSVTSWYAPMTSDKLCISRQKIDAKSVPREITWSRVNALLTRGSSWQRIGGGEGRLTIKRVVDRAILSSQSQSICAHHFRKKYGRGGSGSHGGHVFFVTLCRRTLVSINNKPSNLKL